MLLLFFSGTRAGLASSCQVLYVVFKSSKNIANYKLPDNNKRYGPTASSTQHGALHRRSGSMSHHLEGLHSDPALSSLIRPLGTPNVVDSDVFPPSRSQAPNPSIFLPYITEDIAFEEEYEEYLSDLGWSDEQATEGPLIGGTSAWHRLPDFAAEIADGISDSESIVSIGDLGDDSRLDSTRDDRDIVDENLNNWEVGHFILQIWVVHG